MPTKNQPERTFIVLSLKHTHRRHKAITLWRANDSGYCWPLESAGIYLELLVLKRLGYYNSGCSNIAVPADLVTRLRSTSSTTHANSASAYPTTRRRGNNYSPQSFANRITHHGQNIAAFGTPRRQHEPI